MKIPLDKLEQAARTKPAGYLEDVIRSGRVVDGFLIVGPLQFLRLCAKYRQYGDAMEQLAKPIAVALKMDCLDQQQQLKPESKCAKRRAAMNSRPK